MFESHAAAKFLLGVCRLPELQPDLDVVCRHSVWPRMSWEFQRCWMQTTWWLFGFPTASASWPTSRSITTTSMDARRVSTSVSLPASSSLRCLSRAWIVCVWAAVGGLGGIKRPAEGPTEEPSGKKNQPVESKLFPSSKPARENSPPSLSNNQRPLPSPKQARNSKQVTFTSTLRQDKLH